MHGGTQIIITYLAAATCSGVGEGGGGTSSAEVPVQPKRWYHVSSCLHVLKLTSVLESLLVIIIMFGQLLVHV